MNSQTLACIHFQKPDLCRWNYFVLSAGIFVFNSVVLQTWLSCNKSHLKCEMQSIVFLHETKTLYFIDSKQIALSYKQDCKTWSGCVRYRETSQMCSAGVLHRFENHWSSGFKQYCTLPSIWKNFKNLLSANQYSYTVVSLQNMYNENSNDKSQPLFVWFCCKAISKSSNARSHDRGAFHGKSVFFMHNIPLAW